jgi:putative transposase
MNLTPFSACFRHAMYRALGAEPPAPRTAYRSLVDHALADSDIDDIRRHLQRQHAFGSQRFRAAIKAQLGRHAGPVRIGRPPKRAD